jgi:hypothetical protein
MNITFNNFRYSIILQKIKVPEITDVATILADVCRKALQ